MKKLMMIAMAVLGSVSARADLLVAFDFGAYAGAELQGTSTVVITGIDSPVLITRGTGITATANGGRFNAQGWDGVATSQAAYDNQNYFEFTLTPSAGYSISVTSVFFQVQRSNTGASNLTLRTSADSYATDVNSLVNFAGNNATVGLTTDTTSITGLQNQNGSMTFRVVGYTGVSGGSLGFEGTGEDIQIFGTAVVPEPTTMAFLAMGMGALVAARRKLRS